MKKSLFLVPLLAFTGCMSGTVVKDVDFPATPIDMTRITKKGKACFEQGMTGTSGSGSVIAAAKNGGLNTVRMVEYGTEYKAGGFKQLHCTYVYGD